MQRRCACEVVLQAEGLVLALTVLVERQQQLHDAFEFHELQGAVATFAADWHSQFATTELP